MVRKVIFERCMGATFTLQQAILPTADGYTTADVQLAGERIAAIAPQLEPAGTVIDARDRLLLPGFVNAHTHSSELWQRGAIAPYPLELWLAELHELLPPNPEQVYLSALGTAVETLLSGGTCLVDHLVLIPGRELETIDAAARAYQDIGIRAFIGPLIQDTDLAAGLPNGDAQRSIPPYPQSTAEVLAMQQEAIERYHAPERGLSLMVAPTGTQLCSEALFLGCMELSDRYQLCRHAHLLETKAQQLLAQEKYGQSAVRYLHQLGYLSDRTSLAHCVWLDDAEIEVMAATGATVVHNPLSNLRLGSGIAPLLKYRRAGVNIAYGCDGAASNDAQDMLEVIKIGSLLHNITDRDYRHWIAPREALDIAARGGATGLRSADQFGSLEVGKQADLVLYDLTNLSLLPRTDPIGLLVLGRPTQAVTDVWVRGQQVVAAGQPTRCDLAELRQRLWAESAWRGDRHSAARAQIERHYRQVMQLPE